MSCNQSIMKLTEVPFLRNTKFIFPFSSSSSSSSFLNKPCFIKPYYSSNSIRATTNDDNNSTTTTTPTTTNPSSSSPWLNNWSSPQTQSQSQSQPPNPNIKTKHSNSNEPTRTTAIDRIVLRLRNLGLGSDDDEEEEDDNIEHSPEFVLTGDEKLGDLLRRDWVRPDRMLIHDDDDEDTILPWEKEQQQREGIEDEKRETQVVKKRTMKAPTLAELTLEDSELRRLRTLGTTLRERISIPKAGITATVLDQIHDQWRKSELVRLKFHEVLARDMKTAHQIVQVTCLLALLFYMYIILFIWLINVMRFSHCTTRRKTSFLWNMTRDQ